MGDMNNGTSEALRYRRELAARAARAAVANRQRAADFDDDVGEGEGDVPAGQPGRARAGGDVASTQPSGGEAGHDDRRDDDGGTT